MAKDPAFLFYSDNFQSGTQFFSHEQTGKYIRLLVAQHLHGHLTEKQVLFICGTVDSEVMEKFAKDLEGKYYNKRLEIEVEKRKSFSKSRSDNRLGKTKKDLKKKSKSYVNHMGNGNEDGNGIEKEDKNRVKELKIVFPFNTEKFKIAWNAWKQYKKDQHKFIFKGEHSEQVALKELSEKSGHIETIAINIIQQSIANGWKGLFELKNNNNGIKNNGIRNADGSVNWEQVNKSADEFLSKSGLG